MSRPPLPPSSVRAWLRRTRAALRAGGGAWSRDAFAAAAGCEPSHVSNVEAGRRELSAEHALGFALAAGLSLEQADHLRALAARDRTDPDDAEAIARADEELAANTVLLAARLAAGEVPPPPPGAAGLVLGALLAHAAPHLRGRALEAALLPPGPPPPSAPPAPLRASAGTEDMDGLQAAMLARVPWLVHHLSPREQVTREIFCALPPGAVPALAGRVRELVRPTLRRISEHRRPGPRLPMQVGAWIYPLSRPVSGAPGHAAWAPRPAPAPAAVTTLPVLVFDEPNRWLREVLTRRQARHRGATWADFARRTDIRPSTLYSVLRGVRPFPLERTPAICGQLGLGGEGLEDLQLLVELAASGGTDPRLRERLAERRLAHGIVDPGRDGWLALTRLDWLTLLELLAVPGAPADPAALGALAEPPLEAQAVDAALHGLLRLGLIAVDPVGRPRPTGAVLRTPEELPELQVARLQWRCADRARVALARRLPPKLAEAEAALVSAPAEAAEELLELVRNLYEEIGGLCAELSRASEPDQVFGITLHAAPLLRSVRGQPSP